MTLTEIVPVVEKFTVSEKIRLIKILAEGITTVEEDISPLDSTKIYYLSTPYNAFGAGKLLMNAMNQRHPK